MRCWIYPDQKCNKECAAFLKLESGGGADILVDGVPLWTSEEHNHHAGMSTYCALISPLWEIGESLRRIATMLEEKKI